MKKLFHYALLFVAAGLLSVSFTACGDDDDDTGSNSNPTPSTTTTDTELSNILDGYVDNVIYPTYQEMAVYGTTLYNEIKTLRDEAKAGTATDEQVQKVTNAWLEARARYEKSEAFLLGAANDYNIDPHIDTWPLALQQIADFLNSPSMLANVTTDDEDANIDYVHNALGQNLLGFHAVEFFIFRDGQPRSAAKLNAEYEDWNKDGIDLRSVKVDDEMDFAVAVAGDLMYSIYQLEVCWNSAAPSDHRSVLEDLEWATTMPSSTGTYGDNMKDAGQAGSTYRTVKAAVSAVLTGNKGAGGIADEVGNQKLGNPYGLNGTPDVSYIESPYAWNSRVDFRDNIQSIKNVWYGKYTADDNVDGAAHSFHAYFANGTSEAQALGVAVEDAITNAQTQILAIPQPFVNNYSNPQVGVAIEACNALITALENADNYINSQQ